MHVARALVATLSVLASLPLLAAGPATATLAASTVTSTAPTAPTRAACDERPAAPVRLVLVRHAEVVVNGGADGGRDPSLSARGQARARCLAELLGDGGVTHLIASPWRRTRQTLAPLARRTGLDVAVRDPLAVEALAAGIASAPPGSRVVLAGHSNTIPALAAELGVELSELVLEAGHPAFPRDDHARLVTITLEAGSGAPAERVTDVEEARQPCGARDTTREATR